MTKKIRSISMKFNPVKLGNDVVATMAQLQIQNRDLAVLADTSSSMISRITNAQQENYEIRTLEKICNALDLDPRSYFELEG